MMDMQPRWIDGSVVGVDGWDARVGCMHVDGRLSQSDGLGGV